MKALVRIFAVLSVFALCATAHAEPVVRVSLSGGVEYFAGDNTYEIGGAVRYADGSTDSVGFPISRLEFPLDVAMATAEGEATLFDKWIFRLRISRNLTNSGQSMKDSDWLYGGFGNPSDRDIYSESDVDLTAWIVDFKTRYKVAEMRHGEGSRDTARLISYTNYSFFVGAGWMYQSYSYELSNLTQYSLTAPGTAPVFVSGVGMKYDLVYHIPYAEVGFGVNVRKKFQLDLSLGGSAFVHAEDKDEHVLRNLTGEMESGWDGRMIMGNAMARYNFTDHMYCTLEVEGMKIYAEGESQTVNPPNMSYTIQEELESNHSKVLTTFGYTF